MNVHMYIYVDNYLNYSFKLFLNIYCEYFCFLKIKYLNINIRYLGKTHNI